MVGCVQQLITVRVVTSHWPQSAQLHDDECISGAARLLKILYYASIAGQHWVFASRNLFLPHKRFKPVKTCFKMVRTKFVLTAKYLVTAAGSKGCLCVHRKQT